MKKIILNVVFIAVIVIIIGFLLITPKPYTLATPFPVVNESYPVYRTVSPHITHEEMHRMGKLFGFSEEMKETTLFAGNVEITDDPHMPGATLEFYTNSGTFGYQIPERISYSTETQPELPSDEEARAIATQYLRERNLLPADVQFKSVRIGSQFGLKNESGNFEFDLTKDVGFIKYFQGYPLYNAGIVVTIAEKGEVVRVENSLRELEPDPVRYVKIVTPEQAYQKMRSTDLVIKPACCIDGCEIQDITIGYWMEPQTNAQEYVLPVYAFSCDNSWTRYVWAIEPTSAFS